MSAETWIVQPAAGTVRIDFDPRGPVINLAMWLRASKTSVALPLSRQEARELADALHAACHRDRWITCRT